MLLSFLFIYLFYFTFLTLQYCIGFAIYQHESTTGMLLSKFVSVQSLSHVWLFVMPWTPACQASLSITNCRSPPKLMPIRSVMPSNDLILCCPLLLLPSIFPSIRVFSTESKRLFYTSVSLLLSGLPFLSPRDLPNPGIKPMSPVLADGFFTTEPPESPWYTVHRFSLVIYFKHSSGWVCAKLFQPCPALCNPWTVAHQAPLSMGFSRQE